MGKNNICPTIPTSIKTRLMPRPLRLLWWNQNWTRHLRETKNLKLFNPDQLVEAMSKVVSKWLWRNIQNSQGTQFKGSSSCVCRQQKHQLAHGTDGMLEPNISCHYCKDTRHTKDNCVWLNNKITHELQLQEQAKAAKVTSKKNTRPHVPKK